MERPGYKIIPILLLCFSINVSANYKTDIYSAYVNGNMAKWKGVIDNMDAIENKNNDLYLELVNYQYGYIAWCIGNKKNDEAKKYLEQAEKNISILEEDTKNLSLVNSYKAAFYGYRIGLNKLLAPFIGIKSINCAKLAIDFDKENPLGYVQYANIQFYMPAVFGGSKKEAIEYYLIAEKLMEKNGNEITENWNYLSLLIVIAQAYAYLDEFQSSISYFEKILKIEPEFGYVKNELYPEVLKKMKSRTWRKAF
jgi:tetratricopeptide (TPR) repeat protein